jgi:peptidoglycan/LPS O-acetylase OafA/YrhL
MKNISKKNNFDLIRLLAAAQVVLGHSLEHLKINEGFLFDLYENFLKYFPGVPIFFFLSGFLIYWSYDRNNNLRQYIKNRLLRIYPALWFCTLLTVILLVYFSDKTMVTLFNFSPFYLWLIGQVTFFQFYTPDILRFWGVSTPNGSLWTVIVELQYYISVPLLYFILKFNKKYILLFIITSIFTNIFINGLDNNSIYTKLLQLQLFPYLYYFLFGILFYLFWDKIQKIIQNKFLIWFSVYVIFTIICNGIFKLDTFSYWVNTPFKLINDIILCFTVFSFSFSYTLMSDKLLKGNDISYGIYIYHMLVINIFVELKFFSNSSYLFLMFVIVVLLSIFSWVFIEQPCLKLKHKKFLSK